MKKLIACLLALMLFAFASAVSEQPFTVGDSITFEEILSDEYRLVGVHIAEKDADSIIIVFTGNAKNVVINYAGDMSYTLKNVQAGDLIIVGAEISEGMPNLTVSYSLPEDEKEVVYTRMISRSGVDGSYIIMNDWYTEMAWTAAERLCSIASDDAFLSAYDAPGDVRGIIDDIVLPESMPENHYFVSTARLNEAVETYLLEEEILMKEENLNYYLRGLPQVIKNMIVAREGALSLAASSILQAGECMILPDIPFEPGFVVFDAGEANTIIVSMSLAGEGIVSFNASVVSREALSLLTDMEALMDEMM